MGNCILHRYIGKIVKDIILYDNGTYTSKFSTTGVYFATTYNSNNIAINSSYVDGSHFGGGQMYSQGIDITNYKTIRLKYTSSGNGNVLKFGLISSPGSYSLVKSQNLAITSSQKTIDIDVSNLQGVYYVTVSNTSSQTTTASVYANVYYMAVLK